MTTRIVWRYRRKRHTPSAAKNRKQDQSVTVDSQAAGGLHSYGPEELKQAKFQFAEEEEAQTKFQFQEEEEAAQPKVQFAEEEEAQTKIQFQEEEEEEALQTKPEPVPIRSSRLIRSIARGGFKGSPGSFPFARRIQTSFGRHDISRVKAFGDVSAKQANISLGSLAYASKEKVAFRGYPDLHTAAHEAAHIIQQRKGVQLKDGAGRKGDSYEHHADGVADRVVKGKSAESLLGRIPKHEKAGKG